MEAGRKGEVRPAQSDKSVQRTDLSAERREHKRAAGSIKMAVKA
jgi:hypothetical protein